MVTEGLCPVIYESVSQKTQIQVWVPQQRLVTVMLEWQDQGHPWMARAALLRSWRSSQNGPPWLHREELMELGWPFQVIWTWGRSGTLITHTLTLVGHWVQTIYRIRPGKGLSLVNVREESNQRHQQPTLSAAGRINDSGQSRERMMSGPSISDSTHYSPFLLSPSLFPPYTLAHMYMAWMMTQDSEVLLWISSDFEEIKEYTEHQSWVFWFPSTVLTSTTWNWCDGVERRKTGGRPKGCFLDQSWEQDLKLNFTCMIVLLCVCLWLCKYVVTVVARWWRWIP